MLKKLLLIVVSVFLLVSLSHADTYLYSKSPKDSSSRPWTISVGIWSAKISGTVETHNAANGNVDLSSDLGLGTKAAFQIGIDWTNPDTKSGFYLGYTGLHNFGSNRISRTFVLPDGANKITYPINSNVDSDIKFNFVDLYYKHALYRGEAGRINFLAGLKFVNVDLNVDSTNRHSQGHVNSALPILGLEGVAKFSDTVQGFAKIDGFSVGAGGGKVGLFEGDIGLDFLFSEQFGARVSYRFINVNATDSDSNKFNLRYGGPTLDLLFKF